MAGVIERRGGTRAAPRHRKRRALLPRPSRDSVPPVLPTPPLDSEKYSYVRRHICVLTVCMALSFPPLVYSQIRMVENSRWFIVYAPFAVFGVFCFLLSLIVEGMSRSFDLDEHKLFVNNITNKLYYDGLYQSATPFVLVAPGRSATMVVSARF